MRGRLIDPNRLYSADPNNTGKRWMLFVDGENFTLRAQVFLKENKLTLPQISSYCPDVFIWLPNVDPRLSPFSAPHSLQRSAARAYYYTSAVGDQDKIESIKNGLWDLGFNPEVFKKSRKDEKAKGVDIALTKDLLCHAFFDNYDVAVLVAGDGDYKPVVDEVKRMGKLVFLSFFDGSGLGLSEDLRMASDYFFPINNLFQEKWEKFITS